MSQLLHDDNDLLSERERELTLSTGAILGIFLGLVVLCGVFFGFGYNIGRKSAAPATPAASETTATPSTQSSPDFDAFKPAAGSPAGPTGSAPAAPSPTPAAPAPSETTAPAEAPATVRVPATAPEPASTAGAAPAAKPVPPAPAPANGPVVQVAAVSHEQDATLLMNALRAKGYDVAARTEPQDKLIHIQVGPFASRTEADAMRQKLLADGYNAIVK